MKKIIVVIGLLISNLSLFSQWTEFNWDTIKFEHPYPYLKIDTSSQNIWQIGTPQKVFFDSAYSYNKVIVTDTINHYSINNDTYFDLYIGYFNYPYYYPYSIFIEINHKFDTDSLKDGGFITVSYDKGNTWLNIIDDSLYFAESPQWSFGLNLYNNNDSLFNGEKGFTGKSNGWVTTQFAWYAVPVKSHDVYPGDSMILRFNFISDSIQSNKEGWMIDNIRLYSVDMGGKINNIFDKNSIINITPNPFDSQTEIKFDKNYDSIDIEIYNNYGVLVEQVKEYNKNIILFNRNKLSNGLYYCKIRLNDKLIESKKILIIH